MITHDSYRYVNWVLYVFSALVNSFPTQAFSGVGPIIKQKYQISEFQSNIPSLVYPACYVVLLLPANYILDKKGLKIGTLICQICMILGLSIRLLINVNIYYFFLGTLLCGFGFCFIISAANKFANVWFPKDQIFIVSTLCVFCIFASDALGTFLSSYFIRDSSTKEDIFQFFMIQSIAMITINVLTLIFFKGLPKSKQNFASAAQRNTFKQDLKLLVNNKNYITLFFSCTFIFSSFSVMFVFLPWITKAYKFDSSINSFIFLSANLSGFVSCGITGYFLKTIPYKSKCRIFIIGQSLALGLLFLTFQLKAQTYAYIAAGLVGINAYPFLTTITDFSTQTTFPVGQATSSGILLFGGQTIGVIFVTVFSFFFTGEDVDNTRILCLIIFSLCVFAFLSLFFTKQILKRDEYENSHERQQKKSLIQGSMLEN